MAKVKIWMIVLFAVVVYLLMGIYADFGNLLSALEKFDWIFLPVLLILATIGYFLRFIKWNFFLRKVDVRLNLKDNLFVFFSGLSMIITPAKVGEIWKAWLIRDINGEGISKTIPVVVIDRVTDLLGLIILSLLGILYYRDSVHIIVLLLIVFTAFFVSIRSRTISNRIISILEKRAGKYSGDIKTMHGTFEITMEPGTLIGMSFLSAFAWFFECLALYLVVYGFGEFIGIVLSTFIFSFASLAGAVSMIPGGLGVAEATISGMLQLFGLNPAIAIGTAIIVRFGTLWYGAILGFSVYFIFRNRIEKYKNQESENVRYEI